MTKNIFVNLCVHNLSKSMEFFKQLGFTFNPQFTNDTAACMVITENIFAMLITPERFADFTKKQIVDAHISTEVLTALSCESKAEVDELMDKVLTAGGKKFRETEDMGFMYSKSFEDLDGHVWELFWMDPSHIKE